MGTKNVFFSFAVLARFCFAVFAFSSALTFAASPNWQPSSSTIYKDNIHFDVGSGDGVVRKGNQFQQLSKSVAPKMGGKPLAALRVGAAANDASIKNGVKSLLRGGLAGVAITQGVGALFDSVDWVLDPTNHTLKKVTEFDSYVPSIDGFGAAADAAGCFLNFRGDPRVSEYFCFISNNRFSGSVGARFPTSVQHASQCPAICPPNGYNSTIETPVSPSDINIGVDSSYFPHDSDVSQLVNKNLVNPNVVFIGESDNFSVDDSMFAFSSNQQRVSVPAGSRLSRVNYNGKPLDIRLPSGLPDYVTSVNFDVSQSDEYDADFSTLSETISIPYPSSSTHTFNYNGVPLTISVPPNPNNLETLTLNIHSNTINSYSYVVANPLPIAPPLNEPFPQSTPLPAPNISIIYNTNIEYIVNGEPAGNSQAQTDTNQLPADNPATLFDRIRQNDLLFESLPAFCTWARVVCDFFDWFTEPPEPPSDADFESLHPRNLPIPNLDKDILESNKNCPAPKEIQISSLNTTLTFKYDQICSAVEAINPFFLIICYISAARIVLRA